MASQPWRIGKVARIESETDDTRRFWIEVRELTYFDFIPGQFVRIAGMGYDKKAVHFEIYG
ncbi:MAG: hypothetical protein ABI760_04955 [Ferruginibacter sp.]